METIKRIVVVTEQGIESFFKSDDTEIKEAQFRGDCGDPYPCFHVLKDGVVKNEIRCIHNVVIEYE